MPTQYPQPPDPMSFSVLVIEEDPLVRTYHATLLTAYGFQVRSVESAEAALAELQNHALPALIMLDLEMAGRSGWTFRRRQLAEERLAGIPVIVCSGLDAPADDPLFDGCLFLAKPASVGAVRDGLRAALGTQPALAASVP